MIVTDYLDMVISSAFVIVVGHLHNSSQRKSGWLYPFQPAEDGEALYGQQKQDQELTVAQIMNSLLPNSELNWRSGESQ